MLDFEYKLILLGFCMKIDFLHQSIFLFAASSVFQPTLFYAPIVITQSPQTKQLSPPSMAKVQQDSAMAKRESNGDERQQWRSTIFVPKLGDSVL